MSRGASVGQTAAPSQVLAGLPIFHSLCADHSGRFRNDSRYLPRRFNFAPSEASAGLDIDAEL